MAAKLKEDTEENKKAEATALNQHAVEKQKILDMEKDLDNYDNTTFDQDTAELFAGDLEAAWLKFRDQDGILRELYTASTLDSVRKDFQSVKASYLVIKRACTMVLSPIRKAERESEKLQKAALEEKIALERVRMEAKSRKKNSDDADEEDVKVHTMKLPETKLPTFSGNYRDWNSFKDLFEAICKGQRIAKVQKMHLLLTHLDGAAKRTVSGIPICDNGFDIAWNLLVQRYSNDREMLRTFVNDMCDYKGPVQEVGDSPRELRDIITTFIYNGARLVKSTESKDFPWEAFFVTFVERTLSVEAKLRWDEEIQRIMKDAGPNASLTTVNLANFLDFLTRRGEISDSKKRPEAKKGQQAFQPTKGTQGKKTNGGGHQVLHTEAGTTKKGLTCICCKKDGHGVWACKDFKSQNYDARRDVITRANVCFRCFKAGHRSKDCRGNVVCSSCQGRHNTLLHFDKDDESPGPKPKSKEDATVNFTLTSSSTTIFTTAVVEIQDYHGNWIKCRALFDDGSSPNCITQRCVDRLGLQSFNDGSRIRTMTAPGGRPVEGCVKLQLRSRVDKDYVLKDEALVVDYDFSRLPSRPVSTSSLGFVKGLPLADPKFNVPGPVDLLICNRVYMASLDPIAHLGNGSEGPIARSSRFGWFVTGAIPEGPRDEERIVNHHACSKIDDVLEKFWTVEEVAAPEFTVKEHELCSDHFKKTYKLEDGRFTVRLPFNDKKDRLGKSFDQAYKRFLSLERRLEVSEAARKATNDFMRKYEDLGHMSIVSESELSNFAIYLPHHAVIKETSTTTKHRQVFDGSAKTSSGIAVNQALMVGPTNQADLIARLIKFRCLPVAITGDISMMYRQINVAPEDRDFQRILWRYNKEEELRHYRLNTVTYGTSSAPFLAIECLRELGRLYQEDHPLGASVVLNDFYVDDLVTGAPNPQEAIAIFEDVSSLVKKGGFELRKWASNSPEVLRHIPEELHDVSPTVAFEDSTTRTLGIQWHHKEDKLSFNISTKEAKGHSGGWTKRTMASAIASVFDPLGLLGPVVIRLKIFLQQLWLEKLAWDDPIPDDVAAAFQEVYEELSTLSTCDIPRCVLKKNTRVQPEYDIHGFCDASGKAYSACIYVVSRCPDGYESHLLVSKTKVAPLKKLTIPRLELCAAVLLASLYEKIKPHLVFKVRKVFAWSDNTTVLHWLRQDLHRLHVFVCNRVSRILEVLPVDHWRHVRTEWNSADCASRGIMPSELSSHQLWWHGPEWLLEEVADAGPAIPEVQEDDVDYWKEVHLVNRTEVLHPAAMMNLDIIKNCALYWRMIRTRALITRIANAKSFKISAKTPLTVEECAAARTSLIKTVQQDKYLEEIAALEAGEMLEERSLRKLSPFVLHSSAAEGSGNRPADGLLRVGGRLAHSKVSLSQKFPIVLPGEHAFTRALVKYYHLRTMHGGPTLLRSLLGQEFWIVGARDVCRTTVNHCFTCLKAKAEAAAQFMADLPSTRVTEARPFNHTGVDYGGHFLVKDRKGRGAKITKGYLALFVCFATKAIHLEFVSALSTDVFIAALHRFVATRGSPAVMQSDSGTNFVGAANEFQRIYEDPEFHAALVKDGIQWKRNTAAAPHHGGLWEAGIKQAKKHLKRTFGGFPLTFEEWTTAAKRVEACLNSRPLTPLSSDPEDLSALTPAHFLVGGPLVSLPEYDLSEVPQNRLSSWQVVQQRSQIFWRRWKEEYLSTLQSRPKWWVKKEFAVGAFVLLKEPTSMLKWTLGVIEEVYPGPDGLVRSVRVRINGKTAYDRPVTKICLLPWDGMLRSEVVPNANEVQDADQEVEGLQPGESVPA